MKRYSLALASLVLCSMLAVAGNPCPPAVVQSPAVTTHLYQPYAVAVLPAVFVPTPSYTVGLSHEAHDGKLDEILRRLDRLDRAEPAKPVAVAQAEAKPETAAAVLASSCQRCHAAAVAADKGGGFTFDPNNLTASSRRQILASVLSGAMPVGGPLTEARKTAVLNGLVQ